MYYEPKTEEAPPEEKLTLQEKLQKFADENNEEINWLNIHQKKYRIGYDYLMKCLGVYTSEIRNFGQIYFSSEKIAEKAMETFKEELDEYFRPVTKEEWAVEFIQSLIKKNRLPLPSLSQEEKKGLKKHFGGFGDTK